MKAAVWYGQKDVRVEDVEVKACEPDEVRVKVAFTGICGSDLHEFLEGPIFIPVDQPDPFAKGFCCKVSKRSLVFQDDSYLSRDS